MQPENARAYFAALAAIGRVPRLRDAVGSWEFAINGTGTWTVRIDHGALSVSEGGDPAATTRFRFDEPEFVRLVRAEGHENLITAGIRNAYGIRGDIGFAQKIQALMPLPEAEERSRT